MIERYLQLRLAVAGHLPQKLVYVGRVLPGAFCSSRRGCCNSARRSTIPSPLKSSWPEHVPPASIPPYGWKRCSYPEPKSTRLGEEIPKMSGTHVPWNSSCETRAGFLPCENKEACRLAHGSSFRIWLESISSIHSGEKVSLPTLSIHGASKRNQLVEGSMAHNLCIKKLLT